MVAINEADPVAHSYTKENTMNENDYILIESKRTSELNAYPVQTDTEIYQAEEILKIQGISGAITFPIYHPGPGGISPETGPDPYEMVKTGEFITLYPLI